MRTSTYNELDGLIFEKTDITTRTIQYSIETVKHILNKRIINTHQKFKVNSFPKIETRTQNIINAFVQLFSHSESINLLTNLSNKSLDSLFRKIKLMVESDYFDDSLLGRELLLERTESYKEKGQPLWIIFSLLFGNYNGSFLSNEIMADCGILNLFSTKDCKSDLLRHFIRLHLLSAFFSYDDDKDVFFDVRTIYKDYCLIFGNDTQITEVFSRSINRLVQARLLISFKYNNSLRNKSKYLSLSEILEDKIAISTAGRYYLTKLIHRIDYLYFMKDDINWDDTSDIVPASKELIRDNKIRNSLKALLKLVKNEYNLLEYIINVTNKQLFSEINLIRMFTNKFSAYNHSSLHNTICYSRWIYESYKKYIYQIIGYDHATFSAEVKSIEDTFKAFEKIENVFLPKRETFNM